MTLQKQSCFTPEQEELIKKQDEYHCVICGAYAEYVDIILPKVKPENTLLNGVAVCNEHYMQSGSMLVRVLSMLTNGINK